MKSFGLWYQPKETKDESGGKMPTDKKPKFDLHVNFWSIEEYNHSIDENNPYLDIGFLITNYTSIKKLKFYCPFKVDEKDVEDLSKKISIKNNANIIFNEDCEIRTKKSYTIIEPEAEEKDSMIIFPLDQVIKNVYSQKLEKDRTYFIFDLEAFADYIKSVDNGEELQRISKIYIRFRLKGVGLSKNIYFDSEPLNKSFESAFSGTRMIDFKINEKRNIDEKVRAEIIVAKEEFTKFNSVHFLVMEPSAYDVNAFDNQNMSCRELEEDLWDDYLNVNLDLNKGHILAYHWKQKEEKSSYSCLVKVNYSKARIVTIVAYALIVIALGILSSSFVTIANILKPGSLKPMGGCVVISVALLGLGIVLGKAKY